MLTNISVRQQRRTERYRVETMTRSSVLLSADVFDNGRVELYEVRLQLWLTYLENAKLLMTASAASARRIRLEQALP